MLRSKTACSIALISLLAGCASFVGETGQIIRIETRSAEGVDVSHADCELRNEHGAFHVRTPGRVKVRRSSSKLTIICRRDGFPAAAATAISRVGLDRLSKLAVGIALDQRDDRAWTYPNWLRLSFGQALNFDRLNDREGYPTPSGTSSPPMETTP